MQKFARFVRGRRKGVVVALLALSVPLVTTAAWGYYSSQREADARARFSQLMIAFDQAVSSKSDRAAFERIIVDAQRIRDEYGSSSVARLAHYYIAMSEANLGRTDRSVQNLQALIRDGDPVMKPLAQFALGAIYRNNGDTQKAIEVDKALFESGVYSKREGHSGNHPKAEKPQGRGTK